MLLDSNICNSILTIGCQHLPPRGGVAQVLYIYDKYIFASFNKLTDTCYGNKVRKLWQFVISFLSLWTKLLFNDRIKIVHIHTSSYNSFVRSSFFVRLAKMMKRRIILHVHGGDFKNFYNSSPDKISAILNKCDCIIALSESWKDFFCSIVSGPDVIVIPNPIEPPRYEVFSSSDHKLHILYLGLITRAKGIYDLLEVLRRNKETFDEKLVLHIGGNGEIDYLNALIEQYDLGNIVKYEGWLDSEKKTEIMNKCSVFILPSYAEGMPLSILEALSYGQYIIATNVGGIPEIVDDKVGALFTPGDLKGLTSLLGGIINASLPLPDRSDICTHADRYLPEKISSVLETVYLNYI